MSGLDFAIVLVWLAIVFSTGVGAGIGETFDGFWANRRRTGTLLLVTTIVATQVGAGTVVGIASSTFSSGTGFGLVALASTVAGFVAVAIMARPLKQFGDRFQAITLPEILRERYGRPTQVTAAIITVFSYLSLLAGQYVALSGLLSTWTGVDMKVALIFAAGGLVVYTAFAGLRGDIATDFVQFWMKAALVFAIIVPTLGMRYPVGEVLRRLPAEAWSPVVFGGMTYLVAGVLLGAIIPIVSMELWMRVYASATAVQAKRAFVWSAVLVIPFYLSAIFLGLLARGIYPPRSVIPDMVFFKLMVDHLPNGLLGLAIGGVFAVILSSANTMILVISSTIVRDLVARGPGDDPRVGFSRVVTALCGIGGAILAAAIPNIVQLMLNAFFMIAVLAPPLFGVAFWRGATTRGATLSLACGAIVTLGALFVIPHQAFVPGLVVAIAVFIMASKVTSHAPNEKRADELFGY